MKNKIKNWMAEATVKQQERIAALAKTSRGHLYQIAAGNREVSVELAARLESASKKMPSNLPPLTRVELATACAKCPYAKQCSKGSENA